MTLCSPSDPDEADLVLSEAQRFLQSYSVLEWPDLSTSRESRDEAHTAAQNIPQATPDGILHIIVGIAQVLGSYCAASDVLLAVQLLEGGRLTFVRISWKESDTYETIVATLAKDLHQHSQIPVTLSTVRQALDLNEKQYPCMALFRVSDSGSSRSHMEYPLTFSYDTFHSQIFLSGSAKLIHPCISTQILSQLKALIIQSKTTPDSPISSIDLPSELMSVWERTTDEEGIALAYPHLAPVQLITDYLTRRSISHPNSIAVRWYHELSPEMDLSDFESMSYLDLNKKGNQIARWLRGMGLETDDKIAVSMDRNLYFHSAMVGIMRAGGCYVPIDPDLPLERKAYIAKDSDARFVFTSTSVSPPSLFGERTIFLEDELVQAAIQAESDGELDLATPDGLSYLLYTSGTTGTPKGCLMTNRGLAQAILALSSTASNVGMPDLSKGHYLAVASIAFDVHLAESFVPVALGMPLISAPRSQLLENLPHYVKKLRITHLGIVPSLIEATMGAVQDESGDENMALRYIASGGEKLSDSILDKWASHPQVRLANFYGPSEATIGCCGRIMDHTTSRANIGLLFANVSGYVLDSNLNILPRGGVGELVIEGPIVGRGYHGRPDLTEKAFMEWPQKGRWAYRTGDLVRMMPDSTLEILGRIDTQIKLRGVRIESEGISSIIRKSVPSSENFLLDATTILAKHPSIGTEQLVSFIAWDTSVSIGIRKSGRPGLASTPKGLMKKIRDTCEDELARYMRPSHIIPLNWLPLSPNGKADAKVLVGIFHDLHIEDLSRLMSSMVERGPGARPATKTEEDIFAVLGRHIAMPLPLSCHPDINIFECGLDSMGVIRFATDLKDTFDQKVSASDIMISPTLAGIASMLTSPPISSPRAEDSYIETFSSYWSNEVESTYPRSTIETILPPFCVQEGVLSRSAEHDTMYVQHVILDCKSGVSLAHLRLAWQATMSKHPILRTVFHFSTALVQVVLRPDEVELPWAEKQTMMQGKENFVTWFLGHEAVTTAKVINGAISGSPPFRVCVYTSPGPTFLVLSIHHALYDGISLPFLMDHIEREYFDSSLRPIALSSDILSQISNVDLAKAREFWNVYFKGFTWTDLRQPTTTLTKRHVCQLTTPFSSLKALAASNQVTLQALLTCTFASTVAATIYQTDDVAFGVIRSGRLLSVDNIENAMFPVVSVVPTRVNFGASENILQSVQKGVSAVVEVEHVPLGKVQSWVRPGGPLFDLLFSVSVKNNFSSNLWDVVESQVPEADYLLSVEVVLDPDSDRASIQAVWKAGELDVIISRVLMREFEAVALNSGLALAGHQPVILARPLRRVGTPDIEGDSEDITDPNLIIKLRRLIATFLGVEETLVMDTTSFISLGLDSIKSVGLSHSLKRQGHNVQAVELMKYTTLRKLAYRLVSRGGATFKISNNQEFLQSLENIRKIFSTEELKLSSNDDVVLYPVTSLQAGMLSQTVTSCGALYVHAFPLQLSSEVDIPRLQKAWKKTVERFGILRTSFHFNSTLGIWAQAVHSSGAVEWSTEGLCSTEDYEAKLQAYLLSIRPGDERSFERSPVWTRLFHPLPQSSDQTPRFVLVLHHALYDGLSVGKLFYTVQALYRGVQLDQSPTQFVDLLGHFVEQEATGSLFWIQKLKNYRPVYLPLKEEDQRISASITAWRDIPCDPIQLKKVLRRTAVTTQCLGQAVWAKLMAQLSGSSDVVFGHIVSGRSVPGAEHVVGPVLNTIPCRISLRFDMTNDELLKSIHQDNVDALPWQHASLRSIQKELGIARLWDSLFLFQPLQNDGDGEPLWKFEARDAEVVSIQYAVNVEMLQRQTGFTIKVASDPRFITLLKLDTLLDRFEKLLESMIFRPDAIIQDDLPEVSFRRNTDLLPQQENGHHPFDLNPIPVSIRTLLASIANISPDQFTPSTPLVTLGIDSITAIQIVAHFRRAGMKLSANDIIISRTVGEMVGKIRPLNAPDATRTREPVLDIPEEEKAAILTRFGDNAHSIENITIASSGMKWLIGSWQKSEGTAFQHTFAYRVPDGFDIQKLRGAWLALRKRLALLRSTFANAKGNGEPRIVTFKLGEYPDAWQEEQFNDDILFDSVATIMKNLVSSPPPTNLPPIRAVVAHSSHRCYLVIHFHHFQFDAWTVPLIADDLSRLYLGLDPVTRNDVASFLQASGPTLENLAFQKKYWQTTFPLQFRPVLLPPLIAPKIPTQKRTIYTTKVAITKAALCEARARALEVPLPSVFLACWAQVQGRLSSSNFATFGLWQAGRSGLMDDIARLASPCSNIVPMYIAGLDGRSAIEVAKDIQNDLRARSVVVLQSDLVRVDEWVGARGRPLCNVVINIVRIAPDVKSGEGWLEQVEMPYFIPDVAPAQLNPTVDRLSITDLVQNDLILDFATLHEDDTILMSLDAADHIMDEDKARELVGLWADAVVDALGREFF